MALLYLFEQYRVLKKDMEVDIVDEFVQFFEGEPVSRAGTCRGSEIIGENLEFLQKFPHLFMVIAQFAPVDILSLESLREYDLFFIGKMRHQILFQ